MPKPPLERLLKRSEFLAVAKQGTREVTPAFILQIYQRSSEDNTRYGVTASLKVGGAVERNRAKRRLRALIREVLSECGQKGTDYVLIARKDILTRDFARMKQELRAALKKVHEEEV